MAMRELDRLKVIQAVIDGPLKPGRATERLGLTVRQVRRLVQRVQAEGAAGLAYRGTVVQAIIERHRISSNRRQQQRPALRRKRPTCRWR